ncbi:helix-turn-helix domain-containing protein [Aerococcus urinae]
MPTLAKRLKSAREAAGLTIEAVSEKIGKSVSTVWRYEQGKSEVNQDSLTKLAALYGVSELYLRGFSDMKSADVIEVPVYKKYKKGKLKATKKKHFFELASMGLPNEEIFAVRINDPSIQSLLSKKDYALVDPLAEIKTGDVLCLADKDSGHLKLAKYQVYQDLPLYLPLGDKTKVRDSDDFEVLGKVFAHLGRV